MTDQAREFLGVGWKFPLQVTPGGKIAQAQLRAAHRGVDLPDPEHGQGRARDAAGLRLRHPRSGLCAQQRGNVAMVTQTVREALVAYEPRIDVLDINVETALEEPNLLLIRINYRIRANNALGNLVYPFYIREGT